MDLGLFNTGQQDGQSFHPMAPKENDRNEKLE